MIWLENLEETAYSVYVFGYPVEDCASVHSGEGIKVDEATCCR